MALDVYFKEDILNVLRATYVASEGPATLVAEVLQDPALRDVPLDKLLRIYRRGFLTAIGAVGIAFGLDSCNHEKDLMEQSLTEIQRRQASSSSTTRSALPEFDMLSFLWTRAQREEQRR
jgi:hypothetical protein